MSASRVLVSRRTLEIAHAALVHTERATRHYAAVPENVSAQAQLREIREGCRELAGALGRPAPIYPD